MIFSWVRIGMRITDLNYPDHRQEVELILEQEKTLQILASYAGPWPHSLPRTWTRYSVKGRALRRFVPSWVTPKTKLLHHTTGLQDQVLSTSVIKGIAHISVGEPGSSWTMTIDDFLNRFEPYRPTRFDRHVP